jgi:polyisoprenoid-binding protein YceI
MIGEFMRFKTIGFLFGACLLAVPAQAATYTVDVEHSSVSFKIKHLFSKVQGNFNKFQGVIDYEPEKPETWQAGGNIDAASIDTNVPERDKHLRSADFFDVEKYPSIEFKSTGVKDVTENSAKLEGLFKMHGVEKPVVLDVTINGIGKDPWGNVRAAFTAVTRIHRKDFGMTWNETLDAGGLLVGEDVDVVLEIEAIQK